MTLSTEEIEQIAKHVVMRAFEVKHAGYTIRGFTESQENIGAFDRAKEDKLVLSCHKKIAEVFGNPNKFEKRLARMDNIPLDSPATKELCDNVIYTDRKKDYCLGFSGRGKGYGKVFWTPYTIQDEELRHKIIHDGLCDNCRTAAHEMQHAIGASGEFEHFNVLPAIYNRIENFPPPERLEGDMYSIARHASRGCLSNFKGYYERAARNMLCAINERYPQELKDALKRRWYSEDEIRELLECACSKDEDEA
jgi:hypothetical protein